MILEKILLKGYLSYIHEEIDFRNSYTTLISGVNGVGKSALLESVPFCWWGVGRGRTITDYINDKCESVRVETIFLMDNVRYKKIRQCGKNTINELYLDKNGKDLESAIWKLISDDTKKKTDILLSSIIGLDYDIFTNSVFFGQKESSSFIEGGSSERKETLSNLLGINVYEKAEEIAKDKIKDLNTSVQMKSTVLNNKMSLVEKKDSTAQTLKNTEVRSQTITNELLEIQKNLENFQDKREKIKIKISNIQKDKERYEELSNQLLKLSKSKKQIGSDLQNNKDDLESTIDEGIKEVELIQNIIEAESKVIEQITDLKSQLRILESKKEKLPEYKKQILAFRSSKEQILSEQTEINTNIKSLNAKKKKIESSGPICPITDQKCEKLNDQSKAVMIDEIDNEKNKYLKNLEIVQKNLESTGNSILEIDQKIENISKVNEKILLLTKKQTELERDLEQINKSKTDLPKVKKKFRSAVDKLTETVENLTTQLKDTDKEVENLTKNVEQIETRLNTDFDLELNKVNQNIKAFNSDKVDLISEKDDLTKKLGQLENEIEQIKTAEIDCLKIKKDIDEINEDIRVYTELAISFGQNGIQKEIINGNVPVLEETANELLSRFTKDSKFKIKFDLDPITKSGKLKKKGGLDIIISEKGKSPRELNMYSGGETVRIVFAILLSLSYLLTKRAGKKSQTLIIDERVAALDQEGISQFIEIVKYISGQYKKIFIVSHITELKESFPNQIEVYKNDIEGSKVTYING
jgi:exonuclease SbcC